MAEPKRHLAYIARGLKHYDCAAVPQLVRRDGSGGERGAFLAGHLHVLAEYILEAIARHRRAFGIDEQLRRANVTADAEPGPQVVRGLLPERKTALAPPLAPDHHARRAPERDVLQQDADQLGDTQTAGEAQVQHRAVPQAQPGGEVGRVQDRPHLVHGEVAYELLVVPLYRDGVDPTDLCERRRHVVLDIAHQRADGGEAQIACGRAVSAFLRACDLAPNDPRPFPFLAKAYNTSTAESREVSEHLERYVQIEPRNAQAHYYYAMSIWKGTREKSEQADLTQVESQLKTAAALDPSFPDAHVQLGNFYASEQNFPEAIAEYNQAITLQPESPEAHYRLAHVCVQTAEKECAAKELAIFERLSKQRGAESERQRNEIRQFVYSMNEQPPAPSAQDNRH